jgi:cytoskeleton protein RodZ
MASFGEELRRERELREITLREVSHATKINIRYLEAMERNDFAYLPGGLFNRGFVRAYCQHIGIDADSMVNAYLLEVRSQDGGDETSRGLLRGQGSRRAAAPFAPEPREGRVSRWWIAAIVLILLAASAWAFWHLRGSGAEASREESDSGAARPAAPGALRGESWA